MFRTFFRRLNAEASTLASAAFFLAAAGVGSRLLGFFRNALLAGKFGAGDELDIYFAAFRIPDFVFSALFVGALSAGFIPVFTRIFHERKAEAWNLASDILNITVLGFLMLTVLFFVVAPQIVPFLFPGFAGDRSDLAVHLSRIMFLQPVFLGISAVLGGVLQSFNRFFVFSLSPIFYNFGIILGVLFLVPIFGVPGLAWGVVLGAVLHMAIQVPTAFSLGFRWKWIIDFTLAGLKRMFTLMVPRSLSLIVTQLNLLAITVIASTLEKGSVAIFALANDLQNFPIGVFAISFAVAAFPALARHLAAGNRKEFIESFGRAFREILFWLLPATALFLVLAPDIVQVALRYGKFETSSAALTTQTLFIFSLGLAAQGLIPLVIRAFFAMENTLVPFLTGLFATAVNVVLSLLFAKTFGVAGLAFAFILSSYLQLLFLLLILRLEFGRVGGKVMLQEGWKFLLGAILAAFFAFGARAVALEVFPAETVAARFIRLGVAGAVGGGAYLGMCLILKCEELSVLKFFRRNSRRAHAIRLLE
ncbi:murein biosynthesis integral membrane protein MurJ [Candidatus Azambacteria bacterium]|nr:murein biosynthesis integral membrane protein MurJ [Candidatus Azambacteria bacterium]